MEDIVDFGGSELWAANPVILHFGEILMGSWSCAEVHNWFDKIHAYRVD